MNHHDKRHLGAARGWLELSGANWLEANNELEEITPQMRAHPEVLTVRIAVYLAAGRKDMAAEVADHLQRVYEMKHNDC